MEGRDTDLRERSRQKSICISEGSTEKHNQ